MYCKEIVKELKQESKVLLKSHLYGQSLTWTWCNNFSTLVGGKWLLLFPCSTWGTVFFSSQNQDNFQLQLENWKDWLFWLFLYCRGLRLVLAEKGILMAKILNYLLYCSRSDKHFILVTCLSRGKSGKFGLSVDVCKFLILSTRSL